MRKEIFMSEKPNIVLFLPDQMRGDCFGKAGHPLVKTPNLDKLSEEGIIFDNAFSPSPICVPARSQLLCGRWGHETGNRWLNQSWRYRFDESPLAGNNGVMLDPEIPTFPELLTNAGYMTAAFGKCHFFPRGNMYGFLHRVNGQATGKYPEDDEYRQYLKEHGLEHLRLDSYGATNGFYYPRDGEDFNCKILSYISKMPAEHQFTPWCAERGIKFLKTLTPERPFFIQLGFHAPHDPYCVSKSYDEIYDWQEIELPDQVEDINQFPSWLYKGDQNGKINPNNPQLSEEEMKKNWAYYLANITFIDKQVGKVVNYLKKIGQYKNTIFIFTSDHGDHMGQHYGYGKTTMLEESIHIPLVIAGEPVKRSGRTDELISLMDLFPTILKIAGVDIPGDLRDAYPIDLDDDLKAEDNTTKRNYIFGELGEGENRQYMVRSMTHKYIYHPEQEAEEFFDLVNDPEELINLVEQNNSKKPETMNELKRVLKQWLDREQEYCYKGRVRDSIL